MAEWDRSWKVSPISVLKSLKPSLLLITVGMIHPLSMVEVPVPILSRLKLTH